MSSLTLKKVLTPNIGGWSRSDTMDCGQLLKMCAIANQTEMNKNTNMISDLKNMVDLQGSHVDDDFVPEPDDQDKNIEDGPKNEMKDRELVLNNRILDAAMLPMNELQEITKKTKTGRSDDAQMSLQNAHLRAQFGCDFVDGYREGLDEYEKEQEGNKTNHKPQGSKVTSQT